MTIGAASDSALCGKAMSVAVKAEAKTIKAEMLVIRTGVVCLFQDQIVKRWNKLINNLRNRNSIYRDYNIIVLEILFCYGLSIEVMADLMILIED